LVKELNKIPNAGVTTTQKDSLVYQAAERRFAEDDCVGAIQKFSDYINSYPDGAFVNNAHYYRATCLNRNKDYANALVDFEFIVEKSDSRFLEKSLLNAARIEMYNKKKYDNALKHYTRLQQVADFKENKLEARRGIMLSAFELKNYSQAKTAATEIQADPGVATDEQNEAAYILGRIAMEQGQHAEAIAQLTKVSKETKTELGAKSTYYVAESYFKQNDLKNAEAWANKVINQTPTHDYWLAKSYLLIADVFTAQNDLFNAKATLQSVIENYKADDEILPAANEKLQLVMAKENKTSKVEPDTDELEAEPTPSKDLQP
jgi:TolA-binding protein